MRLIPRSIVSPLVFSALLLALVAAPVVYCARAAQTPASEASTDPWTPEQTVQAADLVRELDQPIGHPPTVIYVGPHTLYKGAHIPGAVFIGPASNDDGLNRLKKWAADVPRISNIVIYCGCCPMEKCPNIRPAFSTLKDLGFTNLRVLIIPDDFAQDWVNKNYPVQKGGH